MFLKYTWYVAAWSHEVTDQLFARTILGQRVLIYRKSNGDAVAIADYCPHRFAPLSVGRLKGDVVECGYHGLQFDGTGQCIHNPHGTAIPKAAKVPAYPLVERYGLLWIWLADAAKADDTLIPDYTYLVAEDSKTVHGGTLVNANCQLIVDNLLDASHTQFVHQDLLGTDAFARSTHRVIEKDTAVHSNYVIPNSSVPEAYREFFSNDIQTVEYSINFRWQPPGLVRNRVSLIPYDRPENTILRTGTHLLTPETTTTTHYFFSHTRNFELNDQRVDERIRRWQKEGLTDQDGPIIEACQVVMQEMGEPTDLNALRPVLLKIDTACVKARRVLAKLLEDEQHGHRLAV